MLTGSAAVMIALLMVGTAAAANVNTTLVPRFHGVVAPNSSVYAAGCGSQAKLGKAKFSLKTGDSSLSFSGKAGSCKKVPKGFTFYNDASASQGFEAVIALSHAANSPNVTANWGGKYSTSIAATSGSHALSCPGATHLSYFWYNDTDLEWNYNATLGYFANSTYQDIDFGYTYGVGWYSYNFTSSTWGTQPSPFNLNSTTYESTYANSGANSAASCDSSAYENVETNIEVCDTNAGFCWFQTGSSSGLTYQEIEISLADSVDYSGGYTDSYWYGPSSYSYNYSSPATSYNQTGATVEWINETATSYTFQTATNPSATSVSETQVTSLTGVSSWANYTSSFYSTYCTSYGSYCYTPGDHLYAEIEIDADMSATNENWAHGAASFAFNGATLGNGIKLLSINY